MAEASGVNKNVLPKLLERFGMSKERFAQCLTFKLDLVEKWINKEATPSFNQLCKIADYFKKSVIIFFMEDPMLEINCVELRSSKEFDSVEDKKRLVELIDISCNFQFSLAELFENQKNRRCEIFSAIKDKLVFDDESLILWLRNKLKLNVEKQISFRNTSELIEYIREQFYNIGIYIFKESFRLDKVSGFCLFDENIPIIMLNNSVTFTRQLFTIFHEVYHIYLKESNIDIIVDEVERSCDIFASNFLIPISNFENDVVTLYKNSDFEVDKIITFLAEKYKVSRPAIVVRLAKLGKVSPDFCYEFLRTNNQYTRTKKDDISGGNYYFTKMNYLGKTYLNEIIAKYFMGKLSIGKLSKYTQMKSTNAKRMISMISGGRY